MLQANHTAVRGDLGQPAKRFHSVSPACPDPLLSLSNPDSTNAHISGVTAIRFVFFFFKKFTFLFIFLNFYLFILI